MGTHLGANSNMVEIGQIAKMGEIVGMDKIVQKGKWCKWVEWWKRGRIVEPLVRWLDLVNLIAFCRLLEWRAAGQFLGNTDPLGFFIPP